MRVKIISDSTCDLSPELLEAYQIGIVPLIVMKNNQEFLDGITITPADIFAHVASGGSLCSTAARGVTVYQEEFAKYAGEYDGVIHVNIGSGFSSSYQNACIAAADFENVRVIDSKNLSTGQGLVVLKAWELAQSAKDMDELKQQLEDFASRVEASFVLDRLEYMVKGGRCSGAAALGANLLSLKPCIEVKDGKMVVVKKYRGHIEKCLAAYVKDRLAGREDLDTDRIFITHTDVSQSSLETVRNGVAEFGQFRNVIETVAGCTISCHCGPGTMGILFVRKG
ncbi:MAG: DegV family protein [Candidatus Faecousia sp.]|nr:DegV family protein [Candidatus Faecousia sp.]